MTYIISKIIVYLNKSFFLILLILSLESQGFAEEAGDFRPLTLDEKIGQLLIIPACELRGDDHYEDLQRILREGKAGGILLKQGTADGQRGLIDKLQKISPLPLLCLQDGEWGVSMRLSDVISFPRNLTLGAVQDLSLLFSLGQEIGRQCNLVGTHLNLGPVVDVNNNPLNPIIHMRSFGEDPFQVALRAEMVMRGIQSMGIIACAKHFPGHGDTSVDSHVDLPYVPHDREHLQNIELFPFRWLIQSGVKSVMSAHLYVNALAEQELLPATFSRQIITEILQNEMDFQGLVITDALNMKALAKNFSTAEIALNALMAGHDMLLYGDHIAPNIDQILRSDVPEAFAALKRAVENHEISEEMIDRHVQKIMQKKKELGLFQKRCCDPLPNLDATINTPEAYALKKRLFQEAVTVLRHDGMLPLKEEAVAVIEWGSSPYFKAELEKAFHTEGMKLDDPRLFAKLKECSCAVLALSKFPTLLPNFELELNEEAILHALSQCGIPIVAVVFGSPYTVSKIAQFASIVVAYENQREAQEAAADVILGKLSPKGRLPVSVRPHFHAGSGIFW